MAKTAEKRSGWVGRQQWQQLLFAHWPASEANLREKIPPEFKIDTFEGKSWIGVVPFVMSAVRFRGLPPLPGVSNFLELNLRTYVTYRGNPGVYFFSLDANQPIAVWAARLFFHLPYFRSRMRLEFENHSIHYRSHRAHSGQTDTRFDCTYRGQGAIETTAGDLTEWLTERYCFFTKAPSGAIYRGDIFHNKWPLQAAEAEFHVNAIASSAGIRVADVPPLLHYSENLDVKVWKMRRVDR
ncbi:MAG: DUF2071 domain-containing protein [Pirellulales bacterium]|nr:DUF2071 domain-containing protein [Pirellulales bacterium]